MKSSEQRCLAIKSDQKVLVQKVVLKLQELCRVVILHSLKQEDLNVSDTNMRKEVQKIVKQDLKEFTPSPTESSVVVKDVTSNSKEIDLLNNTKLTKNSISQSEMLNDSDCFNDKSYQNIIKQEIENVEYCKENEQNLVNQNLIGFAESEHNIKKEFNKDDGDCNTLMRTGGTSNGMELSVNATGTIKNNNSCLLSLESKDQLCKQIKSDNSPINLYESEKGCATLQEEENVQNNDHSKNNDNPLYSKNQSTDSESLMLPVNLSVIKEEHCDNSDYQRIGKRKLSTHSTSSIIDDISDISVSSSMDEKQINCDKGKLFYPGMFNTDFALSSPYSPLLRSFPGDNINWRQSTANVSSTGSYIVSEVNTSHITSGMCYCPQQDYSANCQEGCCRSSQHNSALQMNCIKTTSASKSPTSTYSDLPLSSSEIPPEHILRCSCDSCHNRSPVTQGCEKYDKLPLVPNFGIKQLSENVNSNGEELFRRIEESLAETETLKSQEEKLLKRIARSLNEAESLKYREEELFKKIERSLRSLTEAETFKSREEELLRKIEMSLAHTGSVRSQDEELLMRIEASLKNSNYGVSDDTSKLELKHEIDSDFSLPLKKRKKRLKLLSEHEELKLMSQARNLKLESFPSYPSTPMISIAELLPTCHKLQNQTSLSSENTTVKLKAQANNLKNGNFSYSYVPVMGITGVDMHQNMPSFDQMKCSSTESSTCYLVDKRYHKNVNSGGKYAASDNNVKNIASGRVTVCKNEENSTSCSCEREGTSEIPFKNDAFISPYKGQSEIENRMLQEHEKCQNRTLEECHFISRDYKPAVDNTIDENSQNLNTDIKNDITSEKNMQLDSNATKVCSNYSKPCSANDYLDMGSKLVDMVDCKTGKKLEVKLEPSSLDCELVKKEQF
ncbi:hypothetical protein C0J52_27700 [Blattella germanica]|nr:hypothetical protein C0J52_27700 [Blattella germanica]